MKNDMDYQAQLIKLYQNIRNKTEALCLPLVQEDYLIQTMPDVSPPKWHLAHTTWFFETFLLTPHIDNFKPFHPLFAFLFNSYYQQLGKPYPRMNRGLLARPTVETVYEYRHFVDLKVIELLANVSDGKIQTISNILLLGLHHEQQHQELLLMDIKYNFSHDSYLPVYQKNPVNENQSNHPLEFIYVEGGIVSIGYNGEDFCFDNELPYHQQIVKPYLLANRLVTNDEYLEFINAGGYQKPEYWLADGWEFIHKYGWDSPLYWQKEGNQYYVFSLNGLNKINLSEPVAHVSYYEANAYASFRQARLPLEVEWEHFANQQKIENGNFLETNYLHPQSAQHTGKVSQMLGDLWEWTSSSYGPYPGYKPQQGALGEYNGKFMSNQIVLRGGSCITPQTHIRNSYRNFFQPEKRWPFTGIRLANDA